MELDPHTLRWSYAPTLDDVRRDFVRLQRFRPEELVRTTKNWTTRAPTVPLPKKLALMYAPRRIGQMLSEYHHWRHRVRTRTRWYPSGYDVVQRWKRSPKTMKKVLERIRKTQPPTMTLPRLAQMAALTNSALLSMGHFRATVSKHLCDVYEPRRVLDFSAGWGDRLTGFLASASVEHITLIDPRPGSIAACKRQHAAVASLLPSPKTLVTHQHPAEEVLPRLPARSVDLIVTSPPYFDLEEYGETTAEAKGQIRTRVANVDEYLRVFLQPVLTHCARVLAPGGVLALNLDDNATTGCVLCKPALQILKTTKLELIGTAGLRKGRGFGEGRVGVAQKDVVEKAEPIYLFRK